MKKLIGILLLVLITAMLLTACGGGGGGAGQVPSAPTGVKAEPGNGLVKISWSEVSGATSYNIYWSTSGVVSKTIGTKISEAANPYDHSSLSNGVTYKYVVAAVNAVGESAESSPVSAIPTAAIPSAPNGLTAASGNNQVALTWAASTGASSYKVYRGGSSGILSSKSVISTVTGTSYTDTSVTNDTPYYYQVTAANLNGESGGSNQANAIPAMPPAPYIWADVFSYAGTNTADAKVEVRTSSAGAYITNATVIINGSTLTYDSFSNLYTGTVTVNKGAAVNLSITDAGVTYSESLTMYSVFPSILAPVSGATWDTTKSYTVAWSAASPAASRYNVDFYKQNTVAVGTTSATTMVTIAANNFTAGTTYQLYVSVFAATPITNAANQSQFNIIAMSAPVSINMQ